MLLLAVLSTMHDLLASAGALALRCQEVQASIMYLVAESRAHTAATTVQMSGLQCMMSAADGNRASLHQCFVLECSQGGVAGQGVAEGWHVSCKACKHSWQTWMPCGL